MKIKREIGEKGQIVIPKDIREHLGLDKGINITFEVRENEIVLKKEDNEKFLEDFLNVSKIKRVLTPKDIKKTLEKQYKK